MRMSRRSTELYFIWILIVGKYEVEGGKTFMHHCAGEYVLQYSAKDTKYMWRIPWNLSQPIPAWWSLQGVETTKA